MANDARGNRVPIMFSDRELKLIDDWRFANRVGSRASAARRLMQIGVSFGNAADRLEDLLNSVSDFDPELDSYRGKVDQRIGQPGSLEHLESIRSLDRRVRALLEIIRAFSKDGDLAELEAEAAEWSNFWRKGDEK